MMTGSAMNILSVQSAVAFGHVGNSAAVFPLQRLGFEVWPVNTAAFSNHPGYGAWRGEVCPAPLVAELLAGIGERGVFASCAAVLSGYLGTVETGAALLDAVGKVKRANPNALYCCDPVIGDRAGGAYVRPGIAAFFRERALAQADLATPNQFELEQLTNRSVGSLADALQAVDVLKAAGPRIVLVTSLERGDASGESSEMLVAENDKAWLVATPVLPIAVNGAGDAIAALFLGHYLLTRSAEQAIAAAAATVFGIIEATWQAGSRELRLVAAQDEIVAPRRRFPPQRVR
jgi:pyridoxine kinase